MSMPSDSDATIRPTPIPLAIPEIRGNEWKYVKDCLDGGWVSSAGEYVDRFEEALRTYVGARFAVATVNGTAALHTALLLAGVRAEDEVLVPALTFIAPANAVRYLGAWPVFIDIEPVYWQIDTERLARFLEDGCTVSGEELRNRQTGRRIRAVVPVHVLGHPVDMDPILELARRYRLTVVEDATESLGAMYKGRPVGSLGHLACFSFNGNKLITTGGGGMVVTDNEVWARRGRYLTTQAKDDPVEYVHQEVGFNYRLSNLQAAMGCAQMEQVADYVAAKRRIAAAYRRGLAEVPGIEPMPEAPWATSVFWMYTVLIDKDRYGMDRRALMERLAEAGIQTRPLWQPLHRSPVYKGSKCLGGRVAESIQSRALSLPCSTGMSAAQHERVVTCLRQLHGR